MLSFKSFCRVVYVMQAEQKLEKDTLDFMKETYDKYLSHTPEERQSIDEHMRDTLRLYLHDVVAFYNDSENTIRKES